jgi:hypothetical protein
LIHVLWQSLTVNSRLGTPPATFVLLYSVHRHGDGVVVLGVVVVVVLLVDGILVVAIVLVTVLDGTVLVTVLIGALLLLLLLLPLAEMLMTVLLAAAVLPVCGLVGSVVETVLGPGVLLLINTVDVKVDVSGGPAVVNADAVDADATQLLLTTYCVIVESSSYVLVGVRSPGSV